MNNNKPGLFSVWKIIGLVITLGALGYRIICPAMYFDSIEMEWGGLIAVFWSMYLINLVAIFLTFTRGRLTLILSIVTASLSALLLCFDGIFLVAKLFDPSGRTMTEMGYFPLANFMILMAGVFCFIGFFSIRKRDAKRRMAAA